MTKKPIGAVKTPTGWAAYNKAGHSWPVDEAEADELEAGRKARNDAAGKPHTPMPLDTVLRLTD